MSNVPEILLKILLYHNSAAVNREICKNQNGFRKGKRTREGIFNLKTINERYQEKQKDVYTGPDITPANGQMADENVIWPPPVRQRRPN